MARMHLIGLAALSLLIGGCVSSDKYDTLKLENQQLQSRLTDADAKAGKAMAERDLLKKQLDAIAAGGDSQNALILNLNKQLADLAAQNADLQGKYERALATQGTNTVIPKEVSNALDEFARQNGDLIDFDAARGMVKFKSDLTFATGSADLTDKAKQAIGRFAQILNSDAAKSYELMVAGHTDNTPVVQPATKARHPDNWYLSSHRAISVLESLVSQRVSPQRIGATGYGDQRPIASNGSAEGKAQNRRVEVVILPSTVRAAPVASKVATPARTAPKTNLNKDNTVAPVDRRDALNK